MGEDLLFDERTFESGPGVGVSVPGLLLNYEG